MGNQDYRGTQNLNVLNYCPAVIEQDDKYLYDYIKSTAIETAELIAFKGRMVYIWIDSTDAFYLQYFLFAFSWLLYDFFHDFQILTFFCVFFCLQRDSHFL